MESIKHIIHLSPENRSFHHILGFLDRPEDHATHYNYDINGKKIFCSAVNPMTGGDAIIHDIAATLSSIKGINNEPMTGFIVANQKDIHNLQAIDGTDYQADPSQIMGYVKEASMPVIHSLAKNFCVCTRWFSSAPSETFPNRSYMIAATSSGRSNNVPRKIWELLYDTTTIFDRLDQANVSWKIYYPDYLDIIENVDMDTIRKLRNVSQLTDLIIDLHNETLPTYSYVELDTDEDSIPKLVPYLGNVESYIGEVYNVLRKSKYWEDTLLIISYDEHGGFYDPVPPPMCCPPDDDFVTYQSSDDVIPVTDPIPVAGLVLDSAVDRSQSHLEDNTAVPVLAVDSSSGPASIPAAGSAREIFAKSRPVSSQPSRFNFDRLGVRVPAILVSPWLDAGFDDTVYDHTTVLAFLEQRFNLQPLTNRDRHANCHFKFRLHLRQDEMPTNLTVETHPNTQPQTKANCLLAFISNLLVDIGHWFNRKRVQEG